MLHLDSLIEAGQRATTVYDSMCYQCRELAQRPAGGITPDRLCRGHAERTLGRLASSLKRLTEYQAEVREQAGKLIGVQRADETALEACKRLERCRVLDCVARELADLLSRA